MNQHNLEASLNKSSFTTALNEYSDLSIYDVRSTMNGYKYEKKLQMKEKPSGAKMFTKPAESVCVTANKKIEPKDRSRILARIKPYKKLGKTGQALIWEKLGQNIRLTFGQIFDII